ISYSAEAETESKNENGQVLAINECFIPSDAGSDTRAGYSIQLGFSNGSVIVFKIFEKNPTKDQELWASEFLIIFLSSIALSTITEEDGERGKDERGLDCRIAGWLTEVFDRAEKEQQGHSWCRAHFNHELKAHLYKVFKESPRVQGMAGPDRRFPPCEEEITPRPFSVLHTFRRRSTPKTLSQYVFDFSL
ncbi:hypothetical protein SDJN02_04434, partial [Cucurbita argyrosperma subsp. argyrosperma]